MVIFVEAEWVWTSDIVKASENNLKCLKIRFSMESSDLYWCFVLGFGLLSLNYHVLGGKMVQIFTTLWHPPSPHNFG